MDLALTVTPHESVRVVVNGQLACEVSVAEGLTRDDLQIEVTRARCAQATVAIVRNLIATLEKADRFGWEDHVNTTLKAKREAYIAGLVDGMVGLATAHPMGNLLPPAPPRHDPSYLYGYETGEGVRRAVSQAK